MSKANDDFANDTTLHASANLRDILAKDLSDVVLEKTYSTYNLDLMREAVKRVDTYRRARQALMGLVGIVQCPVDPTSSK